MLRAVDDVVLKSSIEKQDKNLSLWYASALEAIFYCLFTQTIFIFNKFAAHILSRLMLLSEEEEFSFLFLLSRKLPGNTKRKRCLAIK